MPAPKYLDIYLLRHGHSTANGKGILAGRDNSVRLSPQGLLQAGAAAEALAGVKFKAHISSPIARCVETLKPYHAKVIKDARFQEMHYGEWSGKKLALLAKKSLWKTIQSHPSQVRFPAGESFLEMNARTTDAIAQLAAKYSGAILICSHGDVIKAIIAQAMGVHLDAFQKIVIDPASISVIRVSGSSIQLVKSNDTSHLVRLSQGPAAKARRGHLLGGGAGGSH